VPPASVANNNCRLAAISNFHRRDEDVNRAALFLDCHPEHSEGPAFDFLAHLHIHRQ
jgi:hypothetical protein